MASELVAGSPDHLSRTVTIVGRLTPPGPSASTGTAATPRGSGEIPSGFPLFFNPARFPKTWPRWGDRLRKLAMAASLDTR